jgi:hypothetical protein
MKVRFVIIIGILFSLFMTGCATSNEKTPVEKNLAVVKLTADDFPKGFQLLSDSQVKQLGITPANLAKLFENFFTAARPMNLTVFTNPGDANGVLVNAMIFYPLSMGDIRGWDAQMKDPNKIAQDIATGAGEGSMVVPKLEYTGIGDSSLGFSIVISKGSKMDFLLARRNTTAILIMVQYADALPIDLAKLGGKLDEGVQAAYAKINS